MRQLLIIADDLSGAADCANACMSAGLRAVVTFDESENALQSDVLSVDCDTRHLEPQQAASRVTEVMRSYIAADPDLLLIKKIDSSLRGNVGAEVAAALAEQRRVFAEQRIVAIMAPAFPFNGRTTVNGYQMAHGSPLHETEMWIHDHLPGEAHVPSLLSRAGLLTASLGLDVVRAEIGLLRRAMQDLALTADVLVCDAETEEDLHAIAVASLSLGRRTVWTGSAGLTYHLPHVAGLVSAASLPETPELCDGPSLFVIGSMSSVSRDQAALLAEQKSVNPIYVSPRTLLAGSDSPNWGHIASSIEASLRSGRNTLVKLDAGEWIDQKERRLLTDALGVMLTPYRHIIGGLVASGGETARAVLAGWRVAALQLISEVEPGLPFSVANCDGAALPVLTKAGSFGKPESLLHCLDFLDQLDRSTGSIRRRA